MQICVISLPSAVERRRQVAQQLEQLPLPWRFVDAGLPTDPELRLWKDDWVRFHGRPMSANEVACYSSHFRLLSELAKLDDEESYLVLEDDVILDVDFFQSKETLEKLVRKFGYLRLNAMFFSPAIEIDALGRKRVLRFKKRVWGTLGYFINAKTARTLVRHLKDMRRPLDVEFDRFWAHGVPINCIYPFVAIERSAPSQIGGDRDPLRLNGVQLIQWKLHRLVEKLRCLIAGFALSGACGADRSIDLATP